MVALKSVVHFSIPVSDVGRSARFYTDVVGCRHLSTVARGSMAFLDAAGTCLILVEREPPINPVLDDHGGVHHSFVVAHDDYQAALDHLRARAFDGVTWSDWTNFTISALGMLGGFLGAHYGRRLPRALVRWTVIVVGFGLAGKYFYEQVIGA